jgi:2-oxoisovalerate dehydrogenase E1 component alpha subunit
LQHRDFILNYVKGVPLTALFSQLHEHHRSPNGGHSAPDICGYAQLDMCTDIALANQRKKNDHVVVAFCGEGSNSLGFWHEALSFAGVRNLPIVFVCENNWSAEPDSVELEGDVDDINLKAAGYGFPGITVDGNDAVAMYRVAQEAIERARCGGGPTLIEAKTFPRYGPTEIDHAQYRVTDEVEDCESIDPITVMERYLTGKGLFSQGWKKELVAAFQQELDAAIYAAEIDRCGASA